MISNRDTKIINLRGKEIIPYLRNLARLRIDVFKEWPYLYDGDDDGEEKYLQIYANTENALCVVALEGKSVVGAVTGIPANESMKEVQDAFVEKNLPLDNAYYLGEFMLVKGFRERGIGKKMYLAFETLLKEKRGCEKVVLCEISRDKSDKRKPAEYKSLTPFWESLGYERLPNWKTSFLYKEIGQSEESLHTMHFREKNL